MHQFDSPELAMAVAAEWDAQVTEKGLEPALMPLMTLASTAIDQVIGGFCNESNKAFLM